MLPEGCVEACRGCAHRGWTAAAGEAQKAAFLSRTLAPWADVLAPLAAVPEARRWGYRDRLCLSTAWHDRAWHFGLRGPDDTVVGIPACPVHSARARAVVALLADVLPPAGHFPLVYYVQSAAQVVLVVKARTLPDTGWLTDAVSAALRAAGVEGLWLHLHPSAGRRVLAKRDWHLLWGVPRSVDEAGLYYGPAAFQQLLPTLHARALDEAEAFLDPGPADLVFDLYCGTGSAAARFVRRGARVVAVETGAEAVACALVNAPGAEVLRGACAQRLPQLRARAAHAGQILLYANPPRTGLEPEVTRWLADEARPSRVAILSCSAGTLRRDLDALGATGYRPVRLMPFDFFPHTRHVETLALLAR